MANTNSTVKVTKRDNFNEIMEILKGMGNDTLAEVMAHEIELLDKKRDNKTPSKATLEKREKNAEMTEIVYNILLNKGEKMSIADIKSADERFSDFSSSKMSSLIKPLVDSGKIEKSYVKKVVMYNAI